jgi:hypothetical protein
MQELQADLETARQKLGSLNEDLQTYEKMTSQAFLKN